MFLKMSLTTVKSTTIKNIQSYRGIMYMVRYFHFLQVPHDLIVKLLLIIQYTIIAAKVGVG